MKTYLKVILILLLIIICFLSWPQINYSSEKTTEDVVSQNINYCVSVIACNEENILNGNMGSGVYLKEGILTAYHVIRDKSTILIKKEDTTFYEMNEVVLYDENTDLALIKPTDEFISTYDYYNYNIPIYKGKVFSGEKTISIGSPSGYVNLVSVGNASGRRMLGIQPYIAITTPVNSGHSGSPVFNSDGSLIGILTLKLMDNVAYAVPADVIENFLRK